MGFINQILLYIMVLTKSKRIQLFLMTKVDHPEEAASLVVY